MFAEFEAAAAGQLSVLHEPRHLWAALRKSGWLARLLNAAEPVRLLRSAVGVVLALPSEDLRSDRRRLASDVTGDPHALDSGTTLAGLVLAMLVAAGRMSHGQRPRDAWAAVGVDCDDIVGGLVVMGVQARGFVIPSAAVVTLPPRVLCTCSWLPPSGPDAWVFVTENPSVVSAAADLAAAGIAVRLVCTNGTPSAGEIAAIARLAAIGWRIAVRADFDAAGLRHVAAICRAIPLAIPWRMGVADYLESLRQGAIVVNDGATELIPESPWDLGLSVAMQEKGIAGFEEALLPLLLEDLRRGTPPGWAP